MEKINELISRYYRHTLLVFSVLIFFNTCGNPNRVTNKRLEKLESSVQKLSSQVDSTASKKDLTIEGLRSEKRMIQSTNRKLWDLNRQAEIDKEIEKLSK